MRLYDPFGAQVLVYSMSFTLTDERYLRKTVSDSVTGGVTTNWEDSSGVVQFRLKNGVPQIKYATDGLFYPLLVNQVDGFMNLIPGDTGEA